MCVNSTNGKSLRVQCLASGNIGIISDFSLSFTVYSYRVCYCEGKI